MKPSCLRANIQMNIVMQDRPVPITTLLAARSLSPPISLAIEYELTAVGVANIIRIIPSLIPLKPRNTAVVTIIRGETMRHVLTDAQEW